MDTTEFRQYILGAVRRIFGSLKPGDELTPVVLILSNGQLALLPVAQFMRNDVTKDALMHVLGQVAAQPECGAIALVNEVWTATVAADAPDLNAETFVRPSARPDRQEAAMVRLEVRKGKVECWMAPITKNPDGTRMLAEFKSSSIEDGRMAKALFPENRPTVH